MAYSYFVMGVSGSGKTTIASKLAQKLDIPFYDGDDFHPIANKEKMNRGIPLTDDDRMEWLEIMNIKAIDACSQKGAVIACSALKEKYRMILCKGIESSVKWVVLRGDYNAIYDRMILRKDHFMPTALLRSQFDTIEYPDYGFHVDIDQNPDELVEHILKISAA